MIINGKNKILGRMCTEVAKKLLNEEKVVVVNARNIVISGSREKIFKKYDLKAEKKGKGNPSKNPELKRLPDAIVKRTVRGMLPRTPRGVTALKRLKVFIDVPEEHSKEKLETTERPHILHITLEELSLHLGAKLKKI